MNSESTTLRIAPRTAANKVSRSTQPRRAEAAGGGTPGEAKSTDWATGRASGLGEALDSFRLGRVYVEHSQQLGDQQQLMKALRDVGQANLGALRLRSAVQTDQGAQAAAVDEVHLSQVQYDLLAAVSEQFLDLFAQDVGFLTQHDPPHGFDY